MAAVELGVAKRAAAGEKVCGDAHVLVPRQDDSVLVCVADGLGHGPGAETASQAACRYVEAHAGLPFEHLMRGLDDALRSTRGAAVSLFEASGRTGRARFAGVGNVELRAATQKPFAPVTVPGIVGVRTRSVRVTEHVLEPGDTFVLFTDGVSGRFDPAALRELPAQACADALLREHARGTDDALCVVLRFGRRA